VNGKERREKERSAYKGSEDCSGMWESKEQFRRKNDSGKIRIENSCRNFKASPASLKKRRGRKGAEGPQGEDLKRKLEAGRVAELETAN